MTRTAHCSCGSLCAAATGSRRFWECVIARNSNAIPAQPLASAPISRKRRCGSRGEARFTYAAATRGERSNSISASTAVRRCSGVQNISRTLSASPLARSPIRRCLAPGICVGDNTHLGESALVVDEENAVLPDWRMARLCEVTLLEKPADDKLPKPIDCYQVIEHVASGAAFKLAPQCLVYSLRWAFAGCTRRAAGPGFSRVL